MGSLGKMIADLALTATDSAYPLIVHIPHSIISVASYRAWRAKEGEPARWLYDMVASLLTHSQGGGIGACTVLHGDHPVFYFAKRWDYVWCQVVAYLATYWSPFDVVYRTMQQPRNPLRLFCVAMDSLDAMTTVCALVDGARSKFGDNKFAPVLVSTMLFHSGAIWRMLDRRSAGKPAKSFLAEPGSGLTRAASLSLIYWYLGHGYKGGKHRNQVVVTMTVLYVLNDLLEDLIGYDFFENFHGPMKALLSGLRQGLSLGPSKPDVAKVK